MQLFTSHWRNGDLKDVDATIIGVSRGTPRRSPGYPYKVLRLLAPNDEAWAQQDREAFEEAYARQLEEVGVERILSEIRRISGSRSAVLLCWERLDGSDPGEFCHRRSLAEYLKREAGMEVRELQAGDLPQRPDSPQPRLFG